MSARSGGARRDDGQHTQESEGRRKGVSLKHAGPSSSTGRKSGGVGGGGQARNAAAAAAAAAATAAHQLSSSSSPSRVKAHGKSTNDAENGDHDDGLRVGVLPLTADALTIGDDGRAIVWLDIDNTLYKKSTKIAELMTERIRAYFGSLGLSEEEAHALHKRYYKEYGLAIRGLVAHHKIDALEYDAKCDATLPLDEILAPDMAVVALLRDLDRRKCRVWALTNAYKTHAMRVLRLLHLDQFVEGVIFCDYGQEHFACKPERAFYLGAMTAVGMKDVRRCYFVDDSLLNIRAAQGLGWQSCILFSETDDDQDGGKAEKEENANGGTLTLHVDLGPSFDEERLRTQIRTLSAAHRTKLLHLVLDACLPGDIAAMKRTLDKQFALSGDMISSLPDNVHLTIFEKLPIADLVRCRRVSKRWSVISSDPSLWRSHALALTQGDPTPLVAPDEASEWETLVRGLFFRERNWSKGICQSVTMMPGHTGFVTAMKLKGRTTLVTGSYDETIRVWDIQSGQCTKVLKAKAIACLDFLAGEQGILAAGLYDSGRVMVWDMKSWSLLQTLSGHNRGIRNVAISEEYLVSVGQDKAIVVWDWRSGTKVVRFGQQSNVSLGVSIVDQDKIVAVTVDGVIRTFDLAAPKREIIGQFDVAKLAPSLSSRLAGLKDGSNMMQWFAAHRDTITIGSHNMVVHLRWQEHIVPARPRRRRSAAAQARRDSTASTATSTAPPSTSSDRRRRSSFVHKELISTPPVSTSSTPRRSMAMTSAGLPRSPSSTLSTGSPQTPGTTVSGRTQVPLMLPQSSVVSPSKQRATPSRASSRHSQQIGGISHPSSPSSSTLASPTTPHTPRSQTEDGTTTTTTAAGLRLSMRETETESEGDGEDEDEAAGTRIAPNLAVAPRVVSIVDTSDSAVGCVDAAKRRIVCASRFSSRAGADRRLYTTTFDERLDDGVVPNEANAAAAERAQRRRGPPPGPRQAADDVVTPIGGAWQSIVEQLATPARNPMSLVLDPDHCVVGTSEGLVYSMNFVGSTYTQGWTDERADAHDETYKTMATEGEKAASDPVIANLVELRQVWSNLF